MSPMFIFTLVFPFSFIISMSLLSTTVKASPILSIKTAFVPAFTLAVDSAIFVKASATLFGFASTKCVKPEFLSDVEISRNISSAFFFTSPFSST